jgi:molecular chaperone GrpE
MSDNKESNTQPEDIDIEFEEEVIEETGLNNKLKKLRDELKDAKKQSQEYLTGWQKERADFANFKAEEEKKRKERLELMKTTLVSDFFPVLDSFDMAFGNKDAWEKVDQSWRTGIEYIYTQFMNTLEQYGVSVIDQVGVEFNPHIHDPVETVTVDTEAEDQKVVHLIQKGYRANELVLRPAKVKVGRYEG